MKKKAIGLLLVIGMMAGAVSAVADATALFDFESGDLTGWTVVSGEFGEVVTDRATFHQDGKPYNHQGKWHLSTLEGPAKDKYVGELRVQTPEGRSPWRPEESILWLPDHS